MAIFGILGMNLKHFRKERGWTQQQVADWLGINRVSVTQWEKGDAEPPLKRLKALAALYDVTIDELTSLKDASAFAEPQAQLRLPANMRAANVPVPARHALPHDVPVLGTAAGSHAEGAFQLDSAPIDYVRRPPGLVNARDIYALYIVGDSMEPKYSAGDLVFVHPGRPARIGDAVVVQFVRGAQSDVQAMVAALHKHAGTEVELQKYNPPAIISLTGCEVHAIHRILTNNDLFGL